MIEVTNALVAVLAMHGLNVNSAIAKPAKFGFLVGIAISVNIVRSSDVWILGVHIHRQVPEVSGTARQSHKDESQRNRINNGKQRGAEEQKFKNEGWKKDPCGNLRSRQWSAQSIHATRTIQIHLALIR